MTSEKEIKILIAGEGGQGVQTAAVILARAVFQAGFQASLIPNYGLEQRGGMSLAYLRIADSPIAYPRFSEPDFLVLMSAKARPRVEKYVSRSKKIIETEKFDGLLKEKNLPARSRNMMILGLFAKVLAERKIVSVEAVKREIEEKLKNKKGLADNLLAFEMGLSLSY